MTQPIFTMSLWSATSTCVYHCLTSIQFISSRQPDTVRPFHVPPLFGLASLKHHEGGLSCTRVQLKSVSLLPEFPLSLPLTGLQSFSFSCFSVACPLSTMAPCLLSGFLLSPADTSSLSALCSEWQQTQGATNPFQLPIQNLHASQAVESINALLHFKSFFQSWFS